MKRYSELKIIFSNCLYNGSSWVGTQDELLSVIRSQLGFIQDLDFKGLNSNVVRGDHSSFTVSVFGVFYKYTNEQDRDNIINLEMFTTIVAKKIPDFMFSEVRIEHTRNKSLFIGAEVARMGRKIK